MTLCFTYADEDDDHQMIRMEVASSRRDHLPTLSVAKTYLLVKHHILVIDEASKQQQHDLQTGEEDGWVRLL